MKTGQKIIVKHGSVPWKQFDSPDVVDRISAAEFSEKARMVGVSYWRFLLWQFVIDRVTDECITIRPIRQRKERYQMILHKHYVLDNFRISKA
jgi:hypothetical protein